MGYQNCGDLPPHEDSVPNSSVVVLQIRTTGMAAAKPPASVKRSLSAVHPGRNTKTSRNVPESLGSFRFAPPRLEQEQRYAAMDLRTMRSPISRKR
jgi:hypothetical protein